MAGPVTARLRRFEPLEDSNVHALEQALAHRRTSRAKFRIVREGETSSSFLAILSGWACRYKALDDGSRQITGFMLPGDLCHLNSMVGAPMDHDVAAVGEVTAVLVPRADIDRLTAAHPALERALQWSNIAGEALLRSAIIGLGRRDAKERLGHLLCELWARADAAGLIEDGRLAFEPTQGDLADRVGLTSVHVNRTLGTLREQGLVELAGKHLSIPDVERLAALSGFEDVFLRAITGSGDLAGTGSWMSNGQGSGASSVTAGRPT